METKQFSYSVVDGENFRRQLRERNIPYTFEKVSRNSAYEGNIGFSLTADDWEYGHGSYVKSDSLGFWGIDAYNWQNCYFEFGDYKKNSNANLAFHGKYIKDGVLVMQN